MRIDPIVFDVQTPRGAGAVPLYRSDMHGDGSLVHRLVIMLHGRLRDADRYLRSTQRAMQAAGIGPMSTVVLAPQFLAVDDVAGQSFPSQLLHWEGTTWMSGDDALGPVHVSSFEVLDALIASYADRAMLPALREVVIAGHSGGAQLAHRYAIAGRATEQCEAHGVHCRYVIANPSSYVYFDALRPGAGGAWREADFAACPDVDDWRYGMRRPPRYLRGATSDVLSRTYATKDVVYLLGERDDDPAHPALDRSCAALAQGPHRLARGRHYFAYLRMRFPELRHRYREVRGAGHSAEAMFVSPEGVQALFGKDARIEQTFDACLSDGAAD